MDEFEKAPPSPHSAELEQDEADPTQGLDRVFEIVDPERAGPSNASIPSGSSEGAPHHGSLAPVRPGLHIARLVEAGQGVEATLFGEPGANLVVDVAPGVDLDFVLSACADGHAALVQVNDHGRASVVGVLQTRAPHVRNLTAREITIEGTEHVTLKSGRSALRLRADGSLELLGTRISAASRGLLRLVGRALRLN